EPVPLIETRTAEEARLIIAKRLQQDERGDGSDPTLYLGEQFFEEFGGLSTRRILELAQKRMREQEGEAAEEPPPAPKGGFISTLAAALGFGGGPEDGPSDAPPIEFREHWDRFVAQSEAEIPSDDEALSDALAAALALARQEWPEALDVTVRRASVG